MVEPTHLKNMSVKMGSSSPRNRGENKKSLKNHHPGMCFFCQTKGPPNRWWDSVIYAIKKTSEFSGKKPSKFGSPKTYQRYIYSNHGIFDAEKILRKAKMGAFPKVDWSRQVGVVFFCQHSFEKPLSHGVQPGGRATIGGTLPTCAVMPSRKMPISTLTQLI